MLSQLGWLVGWEKPNIETTQHSFVYSESIYSQQSHPITASFFFTSLFTSNIQNLLLNHIYSESNGLSRLSTSTSLSLSEKGLSSSTHTTVPDGHTSTTGQAASCGSSRGSLELAA